MVELGVAREDLDHLERGFPVVDEEASPLDPAVELESVFGVGGAVEDVPDEGAVEF